MADRKYSADTELAEAAATGDFYTVLDVSVTTDGPGGTSKKQSPANLTQSLDAASATLSGRVELATIAETDTGTDAARALTPAGLKGSALQTKVDTIETSATADQTNAEIKTAYEANADTNAYTDSEQTIVGNTSNTNTGDEVSASLTTEGVIEVATQTEVNAGTDTLRSVSPSTLENSTIRGEVTTNNAKVSYTDAAAVASNTTHRTSDGSDHTFLDQSVISGSSPTLDGSNITGIPAGSVLPVSDATSIVEDPVDPTKEMRIDVGAVATTTIRVLSMPDADVDLVNTPSAAEKTVLGNTTGTNSGDQTTIVGITGTKAQFDTAVTDGNIIYVGDAPTSHTHTESEISDLGTAVALVADDLSVFAATSSLQLKTLLSDETGSGAAVFATSPTLVTPVLGTPASGVATNLTGTAAGLTAGNVTTNANLTGHVTSVGNAAVLGSFTSLQLKTALTNETGSGASVFATSPVLVTPALGTPASGVGTNLTGTAAGLTAGNVTTNANLTGHVTSVGNAAVLGSFTVAQMSTALSDATLSGNNSGDEVSASLTVEGIVEVATQTEVNTGTDTLRTVSPSTLENSTIRTEVTANTTHLSSDGSDHSFIDQDVTSGSSPTLDSANLTGVGGQFTLARVAGSAYSSVQDLQDTFHSAGWVSGGVITDAGGGSITVAVGEGYIRATDSAVAQLLFMPWTALGSTAIPSDTTRYIGVEYNAGTPGIVVKTTDTWDNHTDFPLGAVVNEGDVLHVENSPHGVGDHAAGMIQRSHRVMGIQRDNETGGLLISETGTRNIAVSAGALWDRLTSFSIAAIDTSVTGSFDAYYSDGSSGFTIDAARTAWNNTQYDDGSGVLATLASNKHSVQWFYQELDGPITMIYGGTYNSAAGAEAEDEPVAKPERIAVLSILIGRVVFKESGASALEVQTAFSQTFNAGLASDHGNLTGLTDDDHAQYLLTDGSRVLTGAMDFGSFNLSNVVLVAPVLGTPASGVATNLTGTAAGLTAGNVTAKPTESIIVAASDETTALETGTAKLTFRMPYAFTLTDVRCSVTTAPTGAALDVDINEGGTTILSTNLTIDATEKTSTTAATPPVISDSALADDAQITIDIDTIGSSVAGAGLKVTLIGTRT